MIDLENEFKNSINEAEHFVRKNDLLTMSRILIMGSLFSLGFTLIFFLPFISNMFLYKRIIAGYYEYHDAPTDIGFLVTRKTWERIVPTLIQKHSDAVQSNQISNNQDFRSYCEQLRFWNSLLAARGIIGDVSTIRKIDNYFLTYSQSKMIRKDEYDNLMVLIPAITKTSEDWEKLLVRLNEEYPFPYGTPPVHFFNEESLCEKKDLDNQ